MSDPGFEELQKLWQAPTAAIQPAYQIILRQRRRRWWSRLYLATEVACTFGGIPFTIWLALQPNSLLPGLGSLLLVMFAAGASLWARSVRKVRIEDPLLASLDEGIRSARVGVRLAYAGLWGIVASMFLGAAIGYLWMSAPDLSLSTARRVIVAMIVWFISFGLWFGLTIPYLANRSRELAQLERARSDMNAHF